MIPYILLILSLASVNAVKIQTDGVYLELKADFNGYPIEGDGFVVEKPGFPQIPYVSVKIALPPHKKVSKIEVVPVLKKTFDVPPPDPVPYFARDGMTPILKKGDIYRKAKTFPDKLWEDAGSGILRHIRYHELRVYPYRYDFALHRLTVFQKVEIKVEFADEPSEEFETYNGYDPFEKVYREEFPNYEPEFKVRRRVLPAVNPFSSASMWVKVKATSSGIYKITGSMLSNLGITLPVSSQSLVLYNSSSDTLKATLSEAEAVFKKVPIVVFDGGDGNFDEGDSLYFYNPGMKRFFVKLGNIHFFEHPYSDTNVFWLAIGSNDTPLYMERIDTEYEGDTVEALYFMVRHEENLINPARKGLRWVGEILRMSSSQVEYTFNFTTPDPYETSADGEIVLLILKGAAYFDIYVNGNEYVHGTPLFMINDDTISITGAQIRDGQNELTVVMRPHPSGNDTLNYGNLDYFEFKYLRKLTVSSTPVHYFNTQISGRAVFKIQSQSIPLIVRIRDSLVSLISNAEISENSVFFSDSLIGNEEYVIMRNSQTPRGLELLSSATLDLRDRTWRVDYLIIGKEMFRSAINTYVNYRKGNLFMPDSTGGSFQSADIVYVPLERIYQEFGFGVPDPVSIRNFVYFVYHHSSGPPPTYILFVGDGNYDYKNFTGAGAVNFFPPFEPWGVININDNFHGALDAFYANVEEDGGYMREDIFYGRICARNRSDLKDYFDKVIVYESMKSKGAWRNRVLLVADDEYNDDTHTHHETVHTRDSDDILRNYLPGSAEVMTHYLINYPFNQDMKKPLARRDFKRKFNLGHLIVNIFMHGNPSTLAHEEMFVAPEDYPDIDAGYRNPFLIIASCKVGAFDRITPARVIAEEFAMRKNGAIAVLSATNSTYASANASYVKRMFNALKNYTKYSLGELSIIGKNDPHYVLIGDPSVPINYPAPDPDMSLAIYSGTNPTDTLISSNRYIFKASGLNPGERYVVRFFESKKETVYTRNWGSDVVTIPYMKAPSEFFSGLVQSPDSVVQNFTVPLSVTPGSLGSAYILGNQKLAYLDSLTILSTGRIPPANQGPEIRFYYRGEELKDSSTVPSNFLLEIFLADSDGINLLENINQSGPGIQLIINNNITGAINLTPYFNYRTNSSTEGYALYPINLTNPGLNIVEVIAYDNLKSVNTREIQLYVATSENFELRDFFIYPNPIRDTKGSYITFVLTAPAKVSASIFTIAGTRIWTSGDLMLSSGFHKIYWNGRDLDGDYPANGLYFLALNVEGLNGDKIKKIEKIIIAR